MVSGVIQHDMKKNHNEPSGIDFTENQAIAGGMQFT